MTAEEILKTALALCGETNSAPYLTGFAVQWANAVLAESFDAEQSVRAAEGREALAEVPAVVSLGDELPYCGELCRGAFVFAFAAYIEDISCDRELASVFRQRYSLAAKNAAKAHEHQIFDCY